MFSCGFYAFALQSDFYSCIHFILKRCSHCFQIYLSRLFVIRPDLIAYTDVFNIFISRPGIYQSTGREASKHTYFSSFHNVVHMFSQSNCQCFCTNLYRFHCFCRFNGYPGKLTSFYCRRSCIASSKREQSNNIQCQRRRTQP
ncbi:hypothetical protein D3C85_1192060 [compost metagenome]